MSDNPSKEDDSPPLTKKRRLDSEDNGTKDASTSGAQVNPLRISQVARFLDASADLESSLYDELGRNLGNSADIWKLLDTEDPQELQQQASRSAELQQQLLKTAHLRASTENLLGASAGPIKPTRGNNMSDNNSNNGLDMSIPSSMSVSPLALFNSQNGGPSLPNLTQSQFFRQLLNSEDETPFAASLFSSAHFPGVKTEGEYDQQSPDSDNYPPPPFANQTQQSVTTTTTATATTTATGTALSLRGNKRDIRKPVRGKQKETTTTTAATTITTTTAASSSSSSADQSSSSGVGPSCTLPSMTLPASGEIAHMANVEFTVDNQLKAMKFQQRRVIDNPADREELEMLLRAQAELRKQIEGATVRLEQINETHILNASDAYKLTRMSDTFQVHSTRLRVLQDEIYQLQTAPAGRSVDIKPVAALVIVKQPFPCTVKQSKSVDDPVQVQLITGAKLEMQAAGPVQAELVNEDFNPVPTSKKKNSVPPIQNNQELLDESGIATFKQLTFPHGSRVKSVTMRFAVDLTVADQHQQKLRLHSEGSKPFIVMTNHGQRSTTEGKLLKRHTFNGRAEIPWIAFANAVQLHYIRATKQDPLKPARPLSLKDLEYLHITRFNGKAMITQEDYDAFWAWFGTILYKIRNHQKHILPMWIKGLVYGFLSREDSDRLMRTQQAMPGSFLIRFSDRCAGQFVVVYVAQSKKEGTDGKKVKHYLVKADDIEKKSTLPDFLRDCENLWYILQIVRDPDTGVITLRPRNKDEVLAPYYTRERAQALPFGYDGHQP